MYLEEEKKNPYLKKNRKPNFRGIQLKPQILDGLKSFNNEYFNLNSNSMDTKSIF